MDDLDIAVTHGWVHGIQSIEVPVGPNTLRFPLWIGDFWLKVIEVIEQRTKWKEAQGWMLMIVIALVAFLFIFRDFKLNSLHSLFFILTYLFFSTTPCAQAPWSLRLHHEETRNKKGNLFQWWR